MKMENPKKRQNNVKNDQIVMKNRKNDDFNFKSENFLTNMMIFLFVFKKILVENLANGTSLLGFLRSTQKHRKTICF